MRRTRRGALSLPSMKGPGGRGLDAKEKHMFLISRIEIADLDEAELLSLFEAISRELDRVKYGSAEWQVGMQSLDNIRSALVAKRTTPPRPKPRSPGCGPGF